MTEPTRSLSLSGKWVKLQLNYCNALVIKWIYNIVLFGGRTRDVHSSSLLIDVYALFSDVSLRRQLQWLSWEIPGPFLLKGDVNLFNHLVRKADVAGCCSAGFCSSIWHELPRIQCRWFVLSEVVFTLRIDADQLIRYLRHNWLFDVVWWPPRTLWYVDDNHYHFTGPFRWKKVPKNIVVSSEP